MKRTVEHHRGKYITMHVLFPTKRRYLMSITAGLMASLMLLPVSRAWADRGAAHTPTGEVNGLVYNPSSGSAIAAVRLYFIAINREVYTNAQGEFSLDRVAPGVYAVTAFASIRPQPVTFECVVEASTETYLKVGIPHQGKPAVQQTQSSLPSASLQGRVLLSHNAAPAQGAKVVMSGASGETTTDSLGRFYFDGIAAGVYSVTAFVQGCPITTMPQVTIEPGSDTELEIVEGLLRAGSWRANRAEAEPGTITGVVDNTDGIPVVAARINLLPTGRTAFTDEQGFFRITDVQVACHELDITVEGVTRGTIQSVAVAPHQVTRLKVTAGPSGVVLTSMTLDRWSPGTVWVTVHHAQTAQAVEEAALRLGDSHAARTDSAGMAVFTDVNPGNYTLRASASGFDSATHVNLGVYEGQLTERAVELAPRVALGTLALMVADTATGSAVQAVEVSIDGEPVALRGDSLGRAFVSIEKSRTHTLLVSAEHYAPWNLDSISLTDSDTLHINVRLVKPVTDTARAGSPAAGTAVVDMGTSSVTGRMLRNTEAGLMAERQRAVTFVDGISAADISRAGASNVADAMKRVTGVTLQDGRYVIIRGMSERYIATTVDGQAVPNPDPDKRSVPLDLYPAGLVDNITISKTFTPDKPGEYAGGLVDIKTRAIPDKPLLRLSIKSGGNTQTVGNPHVLSYNGGKLDWLGFDDGTRAMPTSVADTAIRILNYTEAATPQQADSLDAQSKAFNNAFYQTRKKGMPDVGGALSAGTRLNLGRVPVGLLGSFTYSKKTSFYEDGISARYEYSGDAVTSSVLLPNQYRTDSRATEEVLWGALASVGVQPASGHSIAAKYLYVRNSEDKTQRLFGSYINIDSKLESNAMEYSERGMHLGQASGEHTFSGPPLMLQWRLSAGSTQQEQPDQRLLLLTYFDTSDIASRNYSFIGTLPMPRRYYRSLDERLLQASGDLTVFLTRQRDSQRSLKFGGAIQDKSRSYRERYFQFQSHSVESSIQLLNGDLRSYFSDANMGLLGKDTVVSYNRRERQWDTTVTYTWGVVAEEFPSQSANYDATKRIPGLYGMAQWRFADRFDVTGGLRAENTNQKLYAISGDSTFRIANLQHLDWLPALGGAVELKPGMSVLVAYGRTLARPTEREMAPFATYDVGENAQVVGNSDLKMTTIDAVDARWEWFQEHSDLLALSVFYKNLRHPIERVIFDNNGAITYQNVKRGELWGVECEVRVHPQRWIGALSGLRLGGNLALVASRVALGKSEYNDKQRLDPAASPTRTLQGQSPYVINLDAVYELERAGLIAGVYFNVFGPRLSVVSKFTAPDVYEQPAPALDCSLEKKLFPRATAKLGVKNLLNAGSEKTYTFKDKQYYHTRNRKGLSLSLDITYAFK